MEENRYLYETISGKAYELGLQRLSLPDYITKNLKHPLFQWQKEAFEKFLTYQAVKKAQNDQTPTHLMFNMATGSGKTLLMAATILYYYQQGYRRFLFFVNRNNIVQKTEENFINATHPKYLFSEKIIIKDQTVPIKKVKAFSETPQGIEIKFTSVQKLYNDIHIEKENQTTLEELHRHSIVMLADEAHHLNTDTRKKAMVQPQLFKQEMTGRTSQAEVEKRGWEHMVLDLILYKNGQKRENKNVLLEFTATIPSVQEVAEKYMNKIIYRFSLKDFLGRGYTKEINLLSSTLGKKDRVLQALLFQWYRHQIALKHGIANFKPVILFRSKTIEEAEKDFQAFLSWTADLKAQDLAFVSTLQEKIRQSSQLNAVDTTSTHAMGSSRMAQMMEFMEKEKISLATIAHWIRQQYVEKNVILTHSKATKSKSERTDEATEVLLNSLEHRKNPIRAIFTVDRLTEGWDVLNLFDIVRLYQGQNAGGSAKKTPEATIKEKQLIGRGVRYYPFSYVERERHKRKFDDDLHHPLRILEELFYHTYDEKSRYITHLKAELRKDGYIRDQKVVKTFRLKEAFRKSDFYQKKYLWYNRPVDNPARRKKDLAHLKATFVCPPYHAKALELKEQIVTFDAAKEGKRLHVTR